MFPLLEKAVIGMALLRLLSGSIELLSVFFMLKLNSVEKSLMINSSLALVGPIILILSTSIGLLEISEKISYLKLGSIFIGVAFIVYGIWGSPN